MDFTFSTKATVWVHRKVQIVPGDVTAALPVSLLSGFPEGAICLQMGF